MSPGRFISRDPATGRFLKEYTAHDRDSIDHKLALCTRQFPQWKSLKLSRRVELLSVFADLLAKRKSEMALMITAETGKPLTQALAEVEKSTLAVKWLCARAVQALEVQSLESDVTGKLNAICVAEPLGTILGIMPWNFPVWQAVRFLVPSLLAGNVAVLKHASNVMGCLQLLTGMLREAGISEGIFEDLMISSETALKLISTPQVQGVSLTGSTAAGRAVGAAAGAALKPCLLELGGSDPYIVFEDANLELAIDKCVSARLVNTGQSCIAAKRFLVHRKVADAFHEGVETALRKRILGDPRNSKTDLGPLAKPELLAEMKQVLEGLKALGRKVFVSHQSLPPEGYYFSPVLVRDCLPDDEVCQKEVFGPIMPTITFETPAEAIAIANRTSFGLGAAIFTNQEDTVLAMTSPLNAGMIFINESVRSDPRWPFGGIGDSGFGRELGNQGFLSFANLKTIVSNDL